MSEPGITPLAQRLAEENNVDWRSLQGTGDGGRIVERDVLEYLARVMSGQEATDPTPEPMPEGMEAWPEADGMALDRIRNSGTDWQAPTVEDPFVDPFAQDTGDEIGQDEPQWQAEDSADEFAVSFDAEEAERQAGGEYAEAEDETRSAHELASDFLVEDATDVESEVELSEDIFLLDDAPEASEPLQETGFRLAESMESMEADAEPDGDFDLSTDGLLDDDEFEDADLDDLAFEDGELDDPQLADQSFREFETGSFGESLEQQAAGYDLQESEAAQDQLETAYDLGQAESDLLESEAAQDQLDTDEFDIDFGQLQQDEADADQSDWQETEEFTGDLPLSDEVADEADVLARRIEAAFDSVADSPPEFEHLEGDDAIDSAPVFGQPGDADAADAADAAYSAPPVVAVPEAGAAAPLPLANFGNLLRRQLDVSVLNDARALVGSEVTDGDNISASAFLLRAAARAAAETGFLDEQDLRIAAAVIVEGGIELVADGERGFRALAQQLQRTASGSQAGDATSEDISLAVADMSVLEVDEAILDLGVPMLSLGRVLHDEGSGSFRSTLTLSGHFDLKDGARFLQVASELLANPLRLLL